MNDEDIVRSGRLFGRSDSTLDNISQANGMGITDTANSANLYGFNHQKRNIPLSKVTEQQGFVFFTRPDLRLTYDNLIRDRIMALMLNSDEESLWRWVRSTLSPRDFSKRYMSRLTDDRNPFIPILSNNITTLSGWSSNGIDTWQSSAGEGGEQTIQGDGFANDYSAGSLTATFSNQIGDPINHLFHVWVRYILLVKNGTLDPYMDNIIYDRMDYNTRIYRVVLDSSKQFITHISACGAGFPVNHNLASKSDYNKESPFSDENDKVSINFSTVGMIYDDPILIKEFNDLVWMYNPGMVSGNPAKTHVKLTGDIKAMFNTVGLPYINDANGQLEWYVSKADYAAIRRKLGV